MYIQFKKWAVSWQEDAQEFSLFYEGIGWVAQHIRFVKMTAMAGQEYGPAEFVCTAQRIPKGIEVQFACDHTPPRNVTICLTLSDEGAFLHLGGDSSANYLLTGYLPLGTGPSGERMAVRLESRDDILRSGVGEAAHLGCDTLFAADLDAALTLHGPGKMEIKFDRKADQYVFFYQTMNRDFGMRLCFSMREDYYRRTYLVDYKPIGPAGRKMLPVGWMSWYAVQFDAGEKTVLANARAQKEHLAPYGANTIWVDWEWCHRDFTGQDRPGTDMFHPDPEAYPNGLRYVADEIKNLGFLPALWIGPTCDPTYNEVFQKHPDLIIEKKPIWCGQYMVDVTHPAFLNEILPRMIAQAQEWGYQAIKWDEIPITASAMDTWQEKRYDPHLSTRQAMKNAFARVRAMLGDETYMLLCSGIGDREEDYAIGSFDAMRIGGDIFNWDDFVNEGLNRIYETYLFHRHAILCDADNVIIREEFNDLHQARTRASLVSLLGLPFTLGDDLTRLPMERMEILQKCIPPLPARPMELRRIRRQSLLGMIHTRVDREDLSFDLVDIYNLQAEEKQVTLNLTADLHHPQGCPCHAYDYWRQEYLGVLDGTCALDLAPYESRVLALHPVADHPQLISTSRHVGQGAVDIQSLFWDEETGCLAGVSLGVAGDEYAIVCAAPEGWEIQGEARMIADRVWCVSMKPEMDGAFAWQIAFRKK